MGDISTACSTLNYLKLSRNFYETARVKGPQQGRIQDFKLGRAHLEKLRRVEGGADKFATERILGEIT
jgi:hypothetical protein